MTNISVRHLAAPTSCIDQADSRCRWLYERTGENEIIAVILDWLIGTPLKALLIIVMAWIVIRLLRRVITRTVRQLVNPNRSATTKLEKLPLPDILNVDVRDPRRQARSDSITNVLTSTSAAVVWTVAAILVLGTFGINLGPLIAGAGIAGVALGFGAQSLVQDCIAGLFMLLEDQYGIGDVVDLGEASGVVESVALRVTTLRGIDGTVWHVPNGQVQRVGNQSQLWSVAIFDVDVAYDTDLEHARQTLMSAVNDTLRHEFSDEVLEEAVLLGVEQLGADGITLRVTVKVYPGQQFKIQRRLREAVKHAFDEANIEIPFPQRTIWTKAASNTEPS